MSRQILLSVLSRTGEWMPLWLAEGWAQFLQTAEILDNQVRLGKLDAYTGNFLQRNPLLPIPTLITVDQHSPYYHEEDKGSMFYAESWALTRYLKMTAISVCSRCRGPPMWMTRPSRFEP